MAKRLGITHDNVLDTALEMIDRDGLSELRITAVAEALGVKPPSLYSHVDGLHGLLDELAMRVTAQFGEVLRSSVDERSGDDAIAAFATAYRGWANRYPGRYELTLRAAPDSKSRMTAGRAALDTMDSLLSGYGLSGGDAVKAGRSLRASLHGFVTLEALDNLGRGSRDESFAFLIDLLIDGIRATPRPPTRFCEPQEAETGLRRFTKPA